MDDFATKTKKIVVIGELNVDLVASGLGREPYLGGEILAADFEMTLGSASAIFACGAHKLGNDVKFISSAGLDEFGEFCIKALRQKGIATEGIERKSEEKTGVTFVLSTDRDRALVTYPGTISTFQLNDVTIRALAGQDHLHLTSYFLQTALRPEFPRLMTEAKNHGSTVSFDPNSDPSGEWDAQLFGLVELADILFVNETEAKSLAGTDNLNEALAVLGARCRCVVIKLGAEGAIAVKDGDMVSVAGFDVSVTDTTGAGDSFAAGFVTGYLNEMTLRDCLLIGNACGALSTRSAGGTAGQPDKDEVILLLRETHIRPL